MKNTVDCFISYQNQFKVLHWQTKFYARHIAYGAFYDSFGELIDKFVEVHMGKYGRVQIGSSIKLDNVSELKVHEFIKEVEDFLINLTKEYKSPGDTDLLNIRDEMLGNLNQLKYLLTLE